MTHTLLLVITPESEVRRLGSVQDAVKTALEPYSDHAHHEFIDLEDEYTKEYNTESWSRIVLADGSLGGWPYGRDLPEGARVEDVPISRMYSFEEFWEMRGCERHPVTGRIGFWENPNGKWDYWCIGGRWTGTIRSGEEWVDDCRADEVNWEFIQAYLELQSGKQWRSIIRYLAGFSDRRFLKRLEGLELIMLSQPLVAGSFFAPTEQERYDVRVCLQDLLVVGFDGAQNLWTRVKQLTHEEFLAYAHGYYHPLICNSVLDETGWHDAERNCSDDDEVKLQKQLAYWTWAHERLKRLDPSDHVTVVDCRT